MKQKLDWNDKKIKKQIHRLLRAGIQLMFFIVFPSIFTAAFAGVRYLAVQIGQTEPLELTAFVKVLCGLCLFTMIFGRFFCGFACAFGSFGDALHALYQNICKKLKIKSVKLPESVCQIAPVLKYLLLGGILILCCAGNEGRMKGRSGIVYSDRDWNVYKRAVFLPISLPDGSRIFIASGLAVLFPAQKQRVLYHRL